VLPSSHFTKNQHQMHLNCRYNFFLLLTYHHSHFLAVTLDFTSFLTMAFLGATHFFYSWVVFGLHSLLFVNLCCIAINGCCYLYFLSIQADMESSTCVPCLLIISLKFVYIYIYCTCQ